MTKSRAPVGIKTIEKLAKERNCTGIVLLSVHKDGLVSVVTWGADVRKCRAIGEWGQGLWQFAVSKIPFETVFGWGNNGVPTDPDGEYDHLARWKKI